MINVHWAKVSLARWFSRLVPSVGRSLEMLAAKWKSRGLRVVTKQSWPAYPNLSHVHAPINRSSLMIAVCYGLAGHRLGTGSLSSGAVARTFNLFVELGQPPALNPGLIVLQATSLAGRARPGSKVPTNCRIEYAI